MRAAQQDNREPGPGTLALIVATAPVGMALLRVPGFVFEVVSPVFQAFAPGKAMLCRPFADVVPEMPDVLPLLERAVASRSPITATEMELKIQRYSGGPLDRARFSFSCVPIPGQGGERVDAIVSTVVETTPQVVAIRRGEAFAKLALKSAAELTVAFEMMLDPVLSCDERGRIRLMNAAAKRLAGVSDGEPFELDIADVPERLTVRWADGHPMLVNELPISRALAGEVVRDHELILRPPGTDRDYLMRASAVPIPGRDCGITAAVVVARDVTELGELDRLKDQFLRVTAHELKTPVAIVKGRAQSLLRLEDDVERRRSLQAIVRGADRIARILDDLAFVALLGSRQLDLQLEPMDLSALVQKVVSHSAHVSPKHEVVLVCAAPATVSADGLRLEPVITHLIDNAIRYWPSGGVIEVGVRVKDARAIVSVKDHGVGIPKSNHRGIFSRFYRAHTDTPYDTGGMGAGLYISKEIVAHHGGSIWFESEEGVGSTFYFALPLAEM